MCEATFEVQVLVDGLKEAVGLEVGKVYKQMIATHVRLQVQTKDITFVCESNGDILTSQCRC